MKQRMVTKRGGGRIVPKSQRRSPAQNGGEYLLWLSAPAGSRLGLLQISRLNPQASHDEQRRGCPQWNTMEPRSADVRAKAIDDQATARGEGAGNKES